MFNFCWHDWEYLKQGAHMELFGEGGAEMFNTMYQVCRKCGRAERPDSEGIYSRMLDQKRAEAVRALIIEQRKLGV